VRGGPPRSAPGTCLAAAGLVARSLGLRLPGLIPVRWRDVELDGVPGRLWRPWGGPAPAVLLPAGITPEGPADPRVMRLAGAIARARRVVFVPRLALTGRELTDDDVERLVRAGLALHQHPGTTGRVTALGFSFGGSFLLLAAADPRIADRLGLVAAFGAYGHLVGLVQTVTTGVALLGGEPHPWSGHQDVVQRTRSRLAGVVREHVRDPAAEPALEAVFTNRDPAETPALVAALPPPFPELLERLSPVNVAPHVRAPVVLLHAVDDPTIPYTEMLRLAAAFPRASTHTVRLFTHVDFVPTPGRIADVVRDLAATWQLASALLAAGR
jgi:dienelactone hydrolase